MGPTFRAFEIVALPAFHPSRSLVWHIHRCRTVGVVRRQGGTTCLLPGCGPVCHGGQVRRGEVARWAGDISREALAQRLLNLLDAWH